MPTKKTASTDMMIPNNFPLFLDIQYAVSDDEFPSEDTLNRYVKVALSVQPFPTDMDITLTLRIVDLSEIHALNLEFRGKDKPTNVLSFPFEMPKEIALPEKLLGDIVICPAVLKQEAKEQHKTYENHVAHMVIHGVLHLLGYDHENESDAEVMESLEIQLLKTLNIDNPYHSA